MGQTRFSHDKQSLCTYCIYADKVHCEQTGESLLSVIVLYH